MKKIKIGFSFDIIVWCILKAIDISLKIVYKFRPKNLTNVLVLGTFFQNAQGVDFFFIADVGIKKKIIINKFTDKIKTKIYIHLYSFIFEFYSKRLKARVHEYEFAAV